MAGTDLSRLAQEGQLRPAFGVGRTILAICRALIRPDKGSVALVGKAGSGKSAIVDQLAIDQASGKLPEPVSRFRIVRISLQQVAGVQPAGRDQNDYWHYFRRLLHEAQEWGVLLFWDEMQFLFHWPQSASVLKPMLARGELRVIAASTPAEFDRFIRQDPALERRFQLIPVEEPNDAELREILGQVAFGLQQRYGVMVGSDVIDECVRLSRHLTQNQPDAGIDILEMAMIRASGLVA